MDGQAAWLPGREHLAYLLTSLCTLLLLLLTDGGFCYLPTPDIGPLAVRYREVRQQLPARGRLDFVSDETDPENYKTLLFIARYQLAPLVLEQKAGNRLVVGDFQGYPDLAAFARQHRLVILQDYRNGLVLFRRDLPP